MKALLYISLQIVKFFLIATAGLVAFHAFFKLAYVVNGIFW